MPHDAWRSSAPSVAPCRVQTGWALTPDDPEASPSNAVGVVPILATDEQVLTQRPDCFDRLQAEEHGIEGEPWRGGAMRCSLRPGAQALLVATRKSGDDGADALARARGRGLEEVGQAVGVRECVVLEHPYPLRLESGSAPKEIVVPASNAKVPMAAMGLDANVGGLEAMFDVLDVEAWFAAVVKDDHVRDWH